MMEELLVMDESAVEVSETEFMKLCKKHNAVKSSLGDNVAKSRAFYYMDARVEADERGGYLYGPRGEDNCRRLIAWC